MDNARMGLRLLPVTTVATVEFISVAVTVVFFNPLTVLIYLFLTMCLHTWLLVTLP